VAEANASCQVLIAASEEMRNSVMFTKLLQLVLSMGSILNRGRYMRTQGDSTLILGSSHPLATHLFHIALGFKLETLSKLADIKSGNKKTTLLHYLASVVRKQPDGEIVMDLLKQLPHVEAASKLILDALMTEVRNIKEGVNISSVSHMSDLTTNLMVVQEYALLGKRWNSFKLRSLVSCQTRPVASVLQTG